MIKRNNKVIKHIYKGEAPKLPDEYQEVEYLESSGTQYIDTGVRPDDQTEGFTIKADYETWKEPGDLFQSIFGQTETPSDSAIGWFIYISRDMYIAGQSGSQVRTLQTSINTGERHSYKLQFGKLIVDETSYNINKNTTYVYKYSISLFARAGAYKNGYSYSRGRMYSARIYDNINVIREFIPCYRKSDDKPGMYDTVNGVFYTNEGTGEFAVGANINYKKILLVKDVDGNVIHRDVPQGYTMLEQLDFNGSQAVLTNIHPNANPSIYVVCALTQNIANTSYYPTVFCDRVTSTAGSNRGVGFYFYPSNYIGRLDLATTSPQITGSVSINHDYTLRLQDKKFYIDGSLKYTIISTTAPVYSQRGLAFGMSQTNEAWKSTATNGLRGYIKRVNVDGLELVPVQNSQGIKGLLAIQTQAFFSQENVT